MTWGGAGARNCMACKGSKRPFGTRMRAAGKEDIALRTLTKDYSSPLGIEALGHCIWITDS
jgi:hypothetical protein